MYSTSVFALVLCISIGAKSLYGQIDNVGSGRALRFDGIDDYINVGNIMDDLDVPFSVSAWVFIDPGAPGGTYPILISQDNAPVYNGFWFCMSPTQVWLEMGDGLGENFPAYRRGRSAPVQDLRGRWSHIAATVSASYNVTLYVNGINVGGNQTGGSSQPMQSVAPTEVAKIGYFSVNGNVFHFKGDMDEVRVWDRMLSESEIRTRMCKRIDASDPGLIAYWGFDETTGTEILDNTNNHWSGTTIGNPTRVFSGAPIGDESIYTYSNSWSGKSVSLMTNDDKIAVDNIQGNPQGIHLYSVSNIPSQTGGLDLTGISAPYFGAFIASTDADNLFDAEYFYKGTVSCQAFIRRDNSTTNWNAAGLPLKDNLQRAEFIKGPGTQIDLNLGADKIICGQTSHTLSTGITDTEVSFLWNTGQKTSEITINKTGTYWVKATTSCGSLSDTVKIVIEKIPESIILPNDESLCFITPRQLKPVSNSAGLDITWQDGSKLSTFEVDDFGLYWVTVKNACGEVTDSVTYTKIEFKEELIPNVITPNGDPYNEHFIIHENIKGLVSLEVYNRWGALIYRAEKYNNDWDSSSLSSGVYFYRLLGNCIGEKKGSLSILK